MFNIVCVIYWFIDQFHTLLQTCLESWRSRRYGVDAEGVGAQIVRYDDDATLAPAGVGDLAKKHRAARMGPKLPVNFDSYQNLRQYSTKLSKCCSDATHPLENVWEIVHLASPSINGF